MPLIVLCGIHEDCNWIRQRDIAAKYVFSHHVSLWIGNPAWTWWTVWCINEGQATLSDEPQWLPQLVLRRNNSGILVKTLTQSSVIRPVQQRIFYPTYADHLDSSSASSLRPRLVQKRLHTTFHLHWSRQTAKPTESTASHWNNVVIIAETVTIIQI